MKILLTNDDGLNAIGIKIMYENIMDKGDVYIVAPEFEQSASSHRITLRKPVFVSNPRDKVYAVSGSPTDCIVIALRANLCPKPDLVISGINSGFNIGEDILYSGTVAAAVEASLSGIPSISVSTENTTEIKAYQRSAEYVCELIPFVLQLKGLWNLNVPNIEQCKGMKLALLGHRTYNKKVKPRYDPFGRPYYWLSGDRPSWKVDKRTDVTILEEGYASLTPFKFTNIEDMILFDKMNIKLAEEKR